MPSDSSSPLVELRPPQHATVQRVQPGDPVLLRYLESAGLLPGAQLDVLEYSPFDQNLRLRVGGRELVLGPAVTSQVFVIS
jgi:Fe2+ transport system protein FeoA